MLAESNNFYSILRHMLAKLVNKRKRIRYGDKALKLVNFLMLGVFPRTVKIILVLRAVKSEPAASCLTRWSLVSSPSKTRCLSTMRNRKSCWPVSSPSSTGEGHPHEIKTAAVSHEQQTSRAFCANSWPQPLDDSNVKDACKEAKNFMLYDITVCDERIDNALLWHVFIYVCFLFLDISQWNTTGFCGPL